MSYCKYDGAKISCLRQDERIEVTVKSDMISVRKVWVGNIVNRVSFM